MDADLREALDGIPAADFVGDGVVCLGLTCLEHFFKLAFAVRLGCADFGANHAFLEAGLLGLDVYGQNLVLSVNQARHARKIIVRLMKFCLEFFDGLCHAARFLSYR